MSVSAITSASAPTAVWQSPVPLGPALPPGNGTAVPTPFAALQKGHKGHHHHHGGASANPTLAAPASAASGVASGSGPTTGSILNASA